MKLDKEHKKFLKNVHKIEHKFSAIKMGDLIQEFHHSFWKFNEIKKAENIKEEWGLQNNQIPFYGDWHDLFYLETDTGQIKAVNDERKIISIWESIAQFENSFTITEHNNSTDDLGVVEASGEFFENL